MHLDEPTSQYDISRALLEYVMHPSFEKSVLSSDSIGYSCAEKHTLPLVWSL